VKKVPKRRRETLALRIAARYSGRFHEEGRWLVIYDHRAERAGSIPAQFYRELARLKQLFGLRTIQKSVVMSPSWAGALAVRDLCNAYGAKAECFYVHPISGEEDALRVLKEVR